MSDNDSRAVPDTDADEVLWNAIEPVLDGLITALLRRDDSDPNALRRLATVDAARAVRAALARDVPAGRDLTAQDVRDAHHASFGVPWGEEFREFVADYLNRIARPARDVPTPTDEPHPTTIARNGCGIWVGDGWTVEQRRDGGVEFHETDHRDPPGTHSYEFEAEVAAAIGAAAARGRAGGGHTAGQDGPRPDPCDAELFWDEESGR